MPDNEAAANAVSAVSAIGANAFRPWPPSTRIRHQHFSPPELRLIFPLGFRFARYFSRFPAQVESGEGYIRAISIFTIYSFRIGHVCPFSAREPSGFRFSAVGRGYVGARTRHAVKKMDAPENLAVTTIF